MKKIFKACAFIMAFAIVFFTGPATRSAFAQNQSVGYTIAYASDNLTYASYFTASDEGKTICKDGKPVLLLRKGLERRREKEVRLHEEVHARQMESFDGGCTEFIKKYTLDAQFRFDTELEAYCMHVASLPLEQHSEEIRRLSLHMYETYGQLLEKRASDKLVREECKKGLRR